MNYHHAVDEVAKYRMFRLRRQQFNERVTVGQAMEERSTLKRDNDELWYYDAARAAIEKSSKEYMNFIYAMGPVRSRINHNRYFVPKKFYER